jgi:hypothetical protein
MQDDKGPNHQTLTMQPDELQAVQAQMMAVSLNGHLPQQIQNQHQLQTLQNHQHQQAMQNHQQQQQHAQHLDGFEMNMDPSSAHAQQLAAG